MKKLFLLLSLLLVVFTAMAQDYKVDWFTIDGGGGESTGDGYSVAGTIGQPDAGHHLMTDLDVTGGFWGGGILPYQQPDLQISLNNVDFIGQGIYNDDARQTLTSNIITMTDYHLLLSNYTNDADNFILSGPAGTDGWTVKYFTEGASPAEITADVTGMNGWSVDVTTPSNIAIRVEISAANNVADGNIYSVPITVISTGDDAATDKVIAQITKLPMQSVSLAGDPSSPVTVNKPVRFTATTTAVGIPEYCFAVGTINSGVTTYPDPLPAFQSSNIFDWTPTTIGQYSIIVYAREKGTLSPMPNANLIYDIKPVLSAVSLTTTPLNTATLGTPVTLTATATGGVNVQYKFLSDTYVLRNFSSSNTYTFTPALVKVYKFTVVTRDLGGANPAATITSAIVNFDNKAALSAVTYTTPSTSSVLAGSTVTFTASATGGSAVQYKFMDGVTLLRDFTTSNTYSWLVPAVAGSHNITVVARDVNGVNPAATVTYSKAFIVKLTLSSVAMTTSPLNAALFGTPVTLTATATGGVNVQYKFMAGTYVMRDFASSNTYTFTPVTKKLYTLTIVARDLGGVNPSATVTSDVTIDIRVALSAVSLATSPTTSSVLGKPVTLTATATGGVNVQYKFLSDTSVLRDFSSSNTYTFTPALVRLYKFTVVTRDLGGANPAATITSAIVNFDNKAALSAVTYTTPSTSSVLAGSTVTFTASATGGSAVQYKFMDGVTLLRDFTTSNTYSWLVPAVAGSHNITVVARDVNGVNPAATVTYSKAFIVKLTLSSVAMTTLPLNAALYGTPVTLTATATGGVNVQYKFMAGTYVMRDFASGNTYTFTPAFVKTYSFTVIVCDLGGSDPTATLTSLPVTLVVTP